MITKEMDRVASETFLAAGVEKRLNEKLEQKLDEKLAEIYRLISSFLVEPRIKNFSDFG
jgi:hypothetical protein